MSPNLFTSKQKNSPYELQKLYKNISNNKNNIKLLTNQLISTRCYLREVNTGRDLITCGSIFPSVIDFKRTSYFIKSVLDEKSFINFSENYKNYLYNTYDLYRYLVV